MKKNVKIIPEKKSGFCLRSIEAADLSNLRIWKNENRKSFFYQEIITPEQQNIWFQNYCKRLHDYIFVIEGNTQGPIGCMGFRLKDDKVDLYNIIRGVKKSGNIFVHNAMYTMLAYIINTYDEPIKCDVLKDNPAVEWYKKCGFAIWEEKEYYVMGIERDDIPEVNIFVEEER